jgi:3-oxoacyl-[acyl-carrier protein] reductase
MALTRTVGPKPNASASVSTLTPALARFVADRAAKAGLSAEFRDATVRRQGVPRLGQPSDIAGAVVLLAGPEAEFISGQTLLVNGGVAFG